MPAVDTPPIDPYDGQVLTNRTADGTYNDLENPAMGMAGSRFGRNVPIENTFPEAGADLLTPSPREISRTVMTRDRAHRGHVLQRPRRQLAPVPDPGLVQPRQEPDRQPHRDPAARPTTRGRSNPMAIPRTRPDPTHPPGPERAAAHLRQHRDPLVGPVEHLRQHQGYADLVRTGVDGKLHVTQPG